jgi:hypothetical protein
VHQPWEAEPSVAGQSDVWCLLPVHKRAGSAHWRSIGAVVRQEGPAVRSIDTRTFRRLGAGADIANYQPGDSDEEGTDNQVLDENEAHELQRLHQSSVSVDETATPM